MLNVWSCKNNGSSEITDFVCHFKDIKMPNYHYFKMYIRSAQSHVFLVSALNGCELYASHNGYFSHMQLDPKFTPMPWLPYIKSNGNPLLRLQAAGQITCT